MDVIKIVPKKMKLYERIKMYQTYIRSQNRYLFACIKERENCKDTVVLLPGFMHSKDDIDYFMTYIREDLYKNLKVNIIQVDIYGTGDSYGNTEEITVDSIINNIKDIAIWCRKTYGEKPYLITRGIYASIIVRNNIFHDLFKWGILLNPFWQEQMDKKVEDINVDEIELGDWINDQKNDDIRKMFENMGAEIRNLSGIKIKSNLLKIILKNEKEQFNSHYKILKTEKKFERDETWQSDVQNEIVKIMSEKIRGK